MALLVGTLLLAVAPFGVALSAANAADNQNEGVCSGTHISPPNGTTKTLTYTAPAGQLISGYCVKAGSANQGDGPVYVPVDPPAASVEISHPSGKDISHYSVTLVPTTPPTTTPPTTTPPTTTPPTTTPPTTTPPTTTPPTTTPPVTTPPSPPVTVAASEPTEVKGEQANEDDTKEKDEPTVEVLGEQASVPTAVAAGLSGDVQKASSSSTELWLAGMSGLLALAIGLGLMSSRRLRGRA